MQKFFFFALVTVATACSFDKSAGADDGSGVLPVNPITPVLVDTDTSAACGNHADCDDGSNCTINRCMGGTCKTYSDPEMDCECVVNSDCDDDLSCTDDYCSVDGVCENLSTCNGEDVCRAEFDACAPADSECVVDANCDDGDPETDDYCTDYACENLANGTVCGNGVCESGEDVDNCSSDCAPPSAEHGIDCAVVGSELTITVTGYITQAFVLPGTGLSDGDYLKIGGEPHGWGDYSADTPERPLTAWAGDTNGDGTPKTYVIDVPSDWTSFNFFLSHVGGSLDWFQLDAYSVTGDCTYTSGDGAVSVVLP